jgi:hypothetical protein
MKRSALFALAGLLALGGAAHAVINANDDVPAATLLLPYFEVELDTPDGLTTLFSINNASAGFAVAHVTLWTDESVPTLDFDVYLTGYDVQTINLRDTFNGMLPITADDPADDVDGSDDDSPNGLFPGVLSAVQDGNAAGTSGPCAQVSYPAGLTPALIAHIRALHTGGESAIYNACGGFDHDDNIARGYITVDWVSQCNLQFPGDPGYFTNNSPPTAPNQLWGDYFYVDPAENFAQGETLVHLETRGVSFGGLVPSFYERYNPVSGEDGREPLPSVFGVRYAEGGAFSGGTDLIIWREATVATNLQGFDCGDDADWFPLTQDDVIGFDEAEHEEDLCVVTSDVSPPPTDQPTCFPLETGRYSVSAGNAAGVAVNPSADFGWLYLDLDYDFTLLPNAEYPSQAWVTAVWSAQGRFSVGFDAIQLGDAAGPLLD